MPETSITIRTEEDKDKSSVATLLAKTYGAEGVKAIELASELRRNIPQPSLLSMVAEQDGIMVACALYAPVKMDEGKDIAVMVSLGIDTQKQIDVKGFLEETINRVQQQGYSYVLMRGTAEDFAEQGFVRSRETKLDLGKVDEGDWLVKDILSEEGSVISGAIELPNFLQ